MSLIFRHSTTTYRPEAEESWEGRKFIRADCGERDVQPFDISREHTELYRSPYWLDSIITVARLFITE